ncbi:M61 family metallopeptidase [Brevundimonas subvibrioides]|uniref:Peptidase M61 domain protein n=1 Tax=Brevundimonas subvibrioides (strain ATCC 15264 / DSM 4735 / LMG 14903 / NBRC 16000 / CB 81) TaxID=633149 RepID=D9QLN9_BRESC|nr:M61 family metallopeptidase [Brevundimonas subvibrioides]ADL01933.1 peptidase M61 domain protein [Brevundimonas subvibrioides ATCC 15264]
MKRLALSACLATLLLASTSALAQVDGYAGHPQTPQPIPAVVDQAWSGVVRLEVDATDLNRRIYQVRETIPVERAGPMTLFFPQWLPGNHGPVGPIVQLGGLIITANGQRVEWIRDTLSPWAYHIEVPAGATEIVATFQHLSPTTGSQGRITMTAEMLNVQWEKMLLYPAGRFHRNITTQASITLPTGWQFGTALEPETTAGNTTTFKPVTLDVLVDSPMFAGEHYRQIDLDPGGRSPVRLNIVADEASNIAPTDEQIGILRNLVDQADYLFGARHYDHYDFLMAMTDRLGGIGLEHHRSSENSVDPEFFTSWESKLGDRDLLAHEYTHSWDGKYRRPAGQDVANFNIPMQNTLLWVYEGQTQFWGKVLAARSGLHNRQQALDALAMDAATYDNTVGREWRAMQDTVNDPIIQQRAPIGWRAWQRSEDYYVEGQLIWLDADTLIREKTNGRRSLDDFAKAFFGMNDGDYSANPYTFEEVVATLNGVVEHDWATFLRTRLDGHGPGAPLDGLTRGGYRLVYTDTPSDYQKTLYGEYGRNDFTYSLGFQTSATNQIGSVMWNGPAFQLGLAPGMQIIAVNGEEASASRLSNAVTAAKGTDEKIELIVKDGTRFRTVTFDYHDGLKYPHLERIEGTPDRLGDLFTARRR